MIFSSLYTPSSCDTHSTASHLHYSHTDTICTSTVQAPTLPARCRARRHSCQVCLDNHSPALIRSSYYPVSPRPLLLLLVKLSNFTLPTTPSPFAPHYSISLLFSRRPHCWPALLSVIQASCRVPPPPALLRVLLEHEFVVHVGTDRWVVAVVPIITVIFISVCTGYSPVPTLRLPSTIQSRYYSFDFFAS